ncbi:uncharacterized protein LOC110984062 [Acanthaster planci]|uniref:Uncharacterized protein LOC110984062 n=1 Tax=Acanthaster planci TaxID=133434 RepID=A0A8B7Z3M1_ACAPL|nr:uncharacterized protein LOC110984062 [Acanthaster planci]
MCMYLAYDSYKFVAETSFCPAIMSPRVILWSLPRSCTTAVLRAVSSVDGGVFYWEPYGCAMYYGPERSEKEFLSVSSASSVSIADAPGADVAYDSSVNTFDWVRQTLEAEHKGASLVFAKDFAFALGGKTERLPVGYQHTFLIRDPTKVIPSWWKMNQECRESCPAADEQEMEEWQERQIGKYGGYDDLLELYDFVKENLEPKPFVMDADDLMAQPEKVLAAYCEATGIPFSNKLLDWEDDWSKMNAKWITCRDQLWLWNNSHHTNVRQSRGFLKSHQLPRADDTNSRLILNPKITQLIDCCKPYYKKLYQQRFAP